MQRLLLAILFLVCSAAAATAQGGRPDQPPKVEVFVGYSAIGEFNATDEEVDTGFASERGFHASVTGNFNRHVGLKADFSFHADTDRGSASFVTTCGTPPCPLVTQDFEFKTRLFNFLVGPEVKARNRTRITPFAHALFGVAHGRGALKTTGTALNLDVRETDTGFAMAFGGGLDIRATRRFSLRALLDYNPVFITHTDTGARDRRDQIRISLGILFH
ncbi:MAG TPA: outer membrane beta-barrel protein [Pyrinomonadaceae bacterium]|nr:outer membrane beta-barrel protein [Pyrinomonadaceae bacterium]